MPGSPRFQTCEEPPPPLHPLPRRLLKLASYIYSAVLFAHLALFFVYAGVFSSWILLAAALDPSRFLPFGAAIVVVVVVGVTVGKQLTAAADKLKQKLREAFDAVMQSKMREAMMKIAAKIAKSQALARAEAGEEELAMGDSEEEDDDEDEHERLMKKSKEEVTPSDIFAAINDGEDEITMAQ